MTSQRNVKNLALIMALSGSIVAAGAVSGAEDNAGREGNRPSFDTLDANGDGKLIRAELDQHMKSRFDGRDTDGNGLLSRSELEVGAKSRASTRIDRMLARVDTDKDGAISYEEMSAARGDRMFGRVDTNGDGAITREEFEQMREHAKAKRGERVQ